MAIQEDFMAGDPAQRVIGKPEEKPARIHAPQKPKPKPTARAILADIQLRKQELEPVIEECARLEKAEEILRGLRK